MHTKYAPHLILSIFPSVFYPSQQQQSFYSHYSGTKEKKKLRIQNTIENEMIEIKIKKTICIIFESVCNSQSSKAFKLAAAYLQVKKGTKEKNNN